MQNILIAGGDRRQLELCAMLRRKGYSVVLYGFEKLGIANDAVIKPDCVFLPVPYRMPDGFIKAPYAQLPFRLEEIITRYPDSVYVLGGCDSEAKTVLGDRLWLDLFADEAFLVRNALLTAQAAVCAYQKESATALCDLHCVVIGYGRIGRFLCRLLAAHGAKVTATARKPGDIELIKAEGYKALRTSEAAQALAKADVVWNTVPVHVLSQKTLGALRAGAKIIELASSPFGMDIEEAKKMGVDVRLEQGLPGRYFPVSAARAILHVFEREEQQLKWN